ncbi:MAG: outer membrane protein assembly factor BamB family protein [Planctomycetota bacterium]|jgi:outer membrane protein assembly factor BamB
MKSHLTTVLFGLIVLVNSACFGVDWPQFRGPNRDGKSPETGLLKQWPEGGPKLLWSVEGLGIGFSSAAVADGMVYTTGMVGDEKQGRLFRLDVDGNPKGTASYGPEWKGSHEGARTTPTIDGDRVYVFSGYGNLACFDAKTGKPKWQVDTLEKFEGKNIKWGLSESVLIYDDKAICTPGGKDATVVALDKMTGETIWTTKGLSEKAAYCSPVVYEIGGKKLIVTDVQDSVVLIDPADGDVVLRIPHEKRHDLCAVSPVYYNGGIYVTTGYTREEMPNRGIMFDLTDDLTDAKLKWTERKLDCHHGGLVLLDGWVHGTNSVIYGPESKRKFKGTWYCLDLGTGKIRYEDRLVGKGSVIWAEGLLYCYGEVGKVGLVKPTDTGYELISSFEVTKGTDEHWAHPSISDGVLYIRHGNAMMAYNIRAVPSVALRR